MREADLVLVIGTRMNWMINYGQRFGSAKVVQIDIEASEIAHNRDVDLGIVGGRKIGAGADGRRDRGATGGFRRALESPWITRLQEDNDRRANQQEALLNSEQTPIHPPAAVQGDTRLPRPRRHPVR